MNKNLLKDLIEQNKSTYDISKIVGKSQTTVRHWLKKYGLKTKLKSFSESKGNPKGNPEIQHVEPKVCPICGTILNALNSYIQNKSGKVYSYCKTCNSKNTIERLRKNKERAINYKGGACNICGYNRTASALEFHHIDPQTKDKTISKRMNSKSWEKQKLKLDKCVLLCSNCHREVHDELRVNREFNVLEWISDPDSSYH
mgnify:CR=1 FL=1